MVYELHHRWNGCPHDQQYASSKAGDLFLRVSDTRANDDIRDSNAQLRLTLTLPFQWIRSMVLLMYVIKDKRSVNNPSCPG